MTSDATQPARPAAHAGTPTPQPAPAHADAPPALAPIVTLGDLTEGLLWPKLLLAPKLALSPPRLKVALILIILLASGAFVAESITGGAAGGTGVGIISRAGELIQAAWAQVWNAALALDPARLATGLIALFVHTPWELLSGYPLASVGLVVLLGPVAIALLLALCRMTACDIAAGVVLGSEQGVRFAAGRVGSAVGAIFGPIAMVWLIALVLAACGWLFFAWGPASVVGGLLYGLILVGALVAVALSLGLILGGGLLLPAIACDGADAVEAVASSLHHVLAAPARVVLYLLTLVALAAGVYLVAGLVAGAVVWLAASSAGAWAGPAGREMLEQSARVVAVDPGSAVSAAAGAAAEPLPQAEPDLSRKIGAFLVRMWTLIPLALVSALVVNTLAAGFTLMYLALRRHNDGQELTELWMPGMLSGTLAEAPSPAPPAGAEPADAPADEDGGAGVSSSR